MKRENHRSKGFLRPSFVVILSLAILAPVLDAKERKGAQLVIRKRNGKALQGELLAVKGENLILMNGSTLEGSAENINDILIIKIVKKSKFFQGLGYGTLIGGGSGALIGLLSGNDKGGWFKFSAGQKALGFGLGLAALGGSIGAIWGATKGINESIFLEGRSPEEIKRILDKLKLQARFPAELPEKLKPGSIKNQNINQEVAQKPAAVPSRIRILDSLKQTKASSKFTRFHLSLLPSYFYSQGITGYKEFCKASDFGDTRPRGSFLFLKYPETNYPTKERNPVIYLTSFRMEYSIGKKAALGFAFSLLGNHEVHGFRRIDLYLDSWGEQVYSELYLLAKYKGTVYYFTAAWMPLPDAYLRKSALKIGGGIGMCSARLSFETSDWEFEDEKEMGEKREFSKKVLGLKAFCEYDYYFSRTWSLGIHCSYEYLPLKIEPFKLTGYYINFDASNNLIHDSVAIDFPQRHLNFGGLDVGLSFGLHL